MAERTQPPRSLPWRGIVFYFLILSFVGVALGIVGGLTEWSEGIEFVAALVVGVPISLAAAHDALEWLRSAREEGQPGRPSSD